MRLVTFEDRAGVRVGAWMEEGVVDLSAWLKKGGQDEALSERLLGESGMQSLIEMGESALELLAAAMGEYESLERDARSAWIIALERLRLLAPIPRPRKNVVCAGFNYTDHFQEAAHSVPAFSDMPEYSAFFTKPATAVIGPGDEILHDPNVTKYLDYEVELGVVIGRKGINIPREKALQYVFGYCIVNDVSARELQKRHVQWYKGKSLDTTCPIGPCIVTADEIPDPQSLDISLRLNGELMQSANTSYMVFPVAELIRQLSQGMTVEPGDILTTGTPSGVGFARTPPVYLKDGDLIEAHIERIGVLTNRVRGV